MEDPPTPRTSVSSTTLRKCATGSCPLFSTCVDSNDGSEFICSPFFDGAFLASQPRPCRHAGGNVNQTNLTTCNCGETLTVCLGQGTNTTNLSSTVEFYYGFGSHSKLFNCSNLTFGLPNQGFLTANCVTAVGMGAGLYLSMVFSPPNAAPILISSFVDVLKYPDPVIVPSTLRIGVNGTGAQVVIPASLYPTQFAFDVSNVVPQNLFLFVYYGLDNNTKQYMCDIDRSASNSTMLTCTVS